MAGGTFPRGFEQMLGRSRSVATTSVMRWAERSGGGGVARRTPTSVRNAEGGTSYFDSEVSLDGFEQVFDLIDVVIPGPPRIAYLIVSLADFTSYGADYVVTHMSNRHLGVVPIRASARAATFSVLVGDYTASTVFSVSTPPSEGTVSVTLWVPAVD